MNRQIRSIYFPFIVILVLFLTGIAGFMVLEGFTFWDSLYMTVITISTVGFSEVKPLSFEGRIFTVFLIMSSFGTFAYTITEVTKYVIDGEFRRLILHIRVDRTIGKLKGHTIICGYGRNGKQAYQTLKESGITCVVVEKDKGIISELMEADNILYIEGDATQDEVLARAGIKEARALITALPNDADNLFVVLTARVSNDKIKIISRASEDNSDTKLRHAGVNNVIMPDRVGGAHMAQLVVKPDVVEFIDLLIGQSSVETHIEEIPCHSLPSSYLGKSIVDLDIRKNWGANIVGFKTEEGEYVFNPSPDTLIQKGSKLFVLGTMEEIRNMKNDISKNS
ncbi:MAG: potassium channel protein [Flavobacteriales bacterium]|nr:potassium channel protein [Flavobacteriales bacterium]